MSVATAGIPPQTETLRKMLIGEINNFSDDVLYEVQNFIEFLDFKKSRYAEGCVDVEYDIPLDAFDYELAKRADARGDEETSAFDDVLQKSLSSR